MHHIVENLANVLFFENISPMPKSGCIELDKPVLLIGRETSATDPARALGCLVAARLVRYRGSVFSHRANGYGSMLFTFI